MTGLLAGLDGARLVRTQAFDQLDELAGFVLPRHEILAIDGALGVGKSVLTDSFVERQTQATVVLPLPPRQTSRDIVRWMHRLVCDGGDSDELCERDLQDDLVARLQNPHTVIIRNVHRLTTEAGGQLEWLHSHTHTNWTLILEGGPGTVKAIQRDPLLGARLGGHLTVPVLTDRALLDALQAMHPLFLDAETDLLAELDTRACHGVLRNWGRFLQIALHLRQEVFNRGGTPPPLERPLSRAVLQKMPATSLPKKKRP